MRLTFPDYRTPYRYIPRAVVISGGGSSSARCCPAVALLERASTKKHLERAPAGFVSAGKKNDPKTKMSPLVAIKSRSVLSLKRNQRSVSAGSFPAGCLIPGESLGVCLLQSGAARYSSKDTKAGALPSVTERYSS